MPPLAIGATQPSKQEPVPLLSLGEQANLFWKGFLCDLPPVIVPLVKLEFLGEQPQELEVGTGESYVVGIGCTSYVRIEQLGGMLHLPQGPDEGEHYVIKSNKQ